MDDFSLRPRYRPDELRDRHAGPRAFFETVAGPDETAYPTEASAPTTYYGRMLYDVRFTETPGAGALTYSYTDYYRCLFNLEVAKYIEDGSVVLCFKESNQWFTIDKVTRPPMVVVLHYKADGLRYVTCLHQNTGAQLWQKAWPDYPFGRGVVIDSKGRTAVGGLNFGRLYDSQGNVLSTDNAALKLSPTTSSSSTLDLFHHLAIDSADNIYNPVGFRRKWNGSSWDATGTYSDSAIPGGEGERTILVSPDESKVYRTRLVPTFSGGQYSWLFGWPIAGGTSATIRNLSSFLWFAQGHGCVLPGGDVAQPIRNSSVSGAWRIGLHTSAGVFYNNINLTGSTYSNHGTLVSTVEGGAWFVNTDADGNLYCATGGLKLTDTTACSIFKLDGGFNLVWRSEAFPVASGAPASASLLTPYTGIAVDPTSRDVFAAHGYLDGANFSRLKASDGTRIWSVDLGGDILACAARRF